MSAGTYAQRVAIEQRRRLVGSIMEYIEREVYPKLTQHDRRALRDKVLAAVGVYHDFVLDSLKAAVHEDGVIVNELVIEKLGELANEVRALQRLTDG